MTIKQASIQDIDQLAILFAQYRVFYQQPFDAEAAKQFLLERIRNQESVIFIAVDGGEYAGFTQLYPCFSSVSMKKIWILNDLFVTADHREKGIEQALINQVIEYTKKTGRKRAVLSTAYDNFNAQKLYEKLGFMRSDFYNYEIEVA
jgi:ribosomal protein S18 acetylase RimI-like enzyme